MVGAFSSPHRRLPQCTGGVGDSRCDGDFFCQLGTLFQGHRFTPIVRGYQYESHGGDEGQDWGLAVAPDELSSWASTSGTIVVISVQFLLIELSHVRPAKASNATSLALTTRGWLQEDTVLDLLAQT